MKTHILMKPVYACLMITGLLAFYFFLPSFLLYSDRPSPSDAVILITGIDNGTREQKAKALVKDGYAGLILIPAKGRILEYDRELGVFHDKGPALGGTPSRTVRQWKRGVLNCPENTHLEFLMGLDMMMRLNLGSAIIVSSPYHMRRIRMIAERESRGTGKRFLFVAADSGKGFDALWIFDIRQVKWIVTEYAKILWFSAYSRFTPDYVLSAEQTQDPGSVTDKI